MSASSRRRSRRAALRRMPPGTPPGTLAIDPQAPRASVRLMAFGPDGFEERELRSPTEAEPFLQRYPVTWIDVDGARDAVTVNEYGTHFNLHRLALEDVINTHQRAKAEAFGSYYYVVARMPVSGQWETEQISFFFNERLVLTFQERPGDCLDAVRLRIRTGWGRGRLTRPDCLVYALLDVLVDHYFPLVQDCDDRLDELESQVLQAGDGRLMQRIHHVKRDLLLIRRAMWPLRDAINTLIRDESLLVSAEARLYLRDVHDHVIQIIDLVESHRDLAGGITDVYLSALNQRTNEVMKVLTLISTVFMPLTFVAGIWGMNFDPDASPWNMPELRWWLGYPLALLLMLLMFLGSICFIARLGWWRSPAALDDPASRATQRGFTEPRA